MEVKRTTQLELDNLVLTIEFTLISIIQGVALYFLTENSHEVIVHLQYAYWPYVIIGLTIIFLFWSRSILHTLTVIHWPLEFGHNFLYIACTLIEAVTFTQLRETRNWYVLSGAYAILIWFLFVWDLQMIRRQMKGNLSAMKKQLYTLVEQDQLMNIRVLMPGIFIFNLIAVVLLRLWPEFFIEKSGHMIIALLQLGGALGYLFYGIRFFTRLTPLITKTREE
jgi:hypothetical protein